ncbi:MAG: AAA family ATPase [Desulfomonilaceae bacterium]|nr:AAA family ATPase [Desulfomonilaceae bacterium]
MKCSKCESEIPDDANFCSECGTGVPVPAHLTVTRPEPTGVPPLPQPERKHVTALFCDLAGYTTMTEKLDPEEVKAITSHIFGEVKYIIDKYEGFIERIIGDALLAFFGVPRAHEDDPIRAVRAAKEIHDLVTSISPRYQAKLGTTLAMHSGINTGLVVTADAVPDKGAHGVAGDAVNVASRLSDLARPGEILVGRDTHVRARDVFAFEDLGLRKVKGKADPIHIFKVLSPKTPPGVRRFDRQISSEMVGRQEELSTLESLIVGAVNGRGSVVNVVGEAGIGKSRLVAELKKRDVMTRVNLVEGRSVSIGKNLSFHPIIDLLKQWAGIAEGDSDREALDKLENAVAAVHPDEKDEIVPFVATLMGMKLTGMHAERVEGIQGEALEKLILKNVRELLIKGTERKPAVIVMEDFHWADGSSMELMKSLYRLVEKHAMVFINVFRPGYFDTGDEKIDGLGERLPGFFVEIPVQPLDRDAGENLIDNMLETQGLPASLKARIIDRSGGNPFFIEEVVRSLIDERAVVRTNGNFTVTEKIDTVMIPPTIQDVITARIDRLEEQTRELVKIAAVIGRSFFYRVVKDVADSIDAVDLRLAYLNDAQIIRSRMRMDELEYLFKHALAQEAAYESILLQQRKQYHLKVADSITRIFSEKLHEFYGTIAYHYGRAEHLEKSEEWLTKAGEEALKSAASNEALAYYQEALAVYQKLQGANVDPEKIAVLEKNIALALFNRGQYTEAVEYFDKALNYYWGELPKTAFSTGFKFLTSFTKFLLALHFPSFWFKKVPTQKDAEAVDLFYKKAEALVVINPKRMFIEFFFFHATVVDFDLTKLKSGVAIFAGASTLFSFIGLSLPIARRILDYAKPRLAPDDAKQLAIYDLMDTQHLFLKGQWSEVTEYNEDLVNRNLRIGETFWAAQHCYWHELPKIYRGDFDAARSIMTKLRNIAEAYENDIYRMLTYLVSIHFKIECRLLREALAEVARGIELVEKKGWAQNALTMHALDAHIKLLMKDPEEARKALDRANQIRAEVRAAPMQAAIFYRSQFKYYLQRLEASYDGGPKRMSAELRSNALKSGKLLIKTCRKVALYRTDSYRLMGVCKWLIDDQEGAFTWWDKAVQEAESLGARAQLARTYSEMCKRLCTISGQPSESDTRKAKDYLAKATTLLCDLGLDHDLEDLKSFVSRKGLEPFEV